jgi:hypothetical protein
MGSRLCVGSDTTLIPDSQFPFNPVSSPSNLLPVYGAGNDLLGYVSATAAQRMLDAGHVIGRGTKQRIRALIAVHDNIDLLPADRPPTNQKYSHNRETEENPPGVWTFRKLTKTTKTTSQH